MKGILLFLSVVILVVIIIGCSTTSSKVEISSKKTKNDEKEMLFFPRGEPGVTELGEGEDIAFFHFNDDSLLVKVEYDKENYRELHTYFGKAKRKLLGVPPQFQQLLSNYRYFNTFECSFNGNKKVNGVGTANIFGIRLFNCALEAKNLTLKEYEVLRGFKGLSKLPIVDANIDSVSIKYVETDYRDAELSEFIKITLKTDNYVLDKKVPLADSKNDSNSDSLRIGNNLLFPAYVSIKNNYMQSDTLHAESGYWFDKPDWWFKKYSKNENVTNSFLWEDNGSPWFNAEYRYYDKTTKTLFLWKVRRQWFTP